MGAGDEPAPYGLRLASCRSIPWRTRIMRASDLERAGAGVEPGQSAN